MITPAIDVNVSLGFWPFQRFVTRTPAALAAHLRRLGIRRGLVSAIESILYPDPDVYDAACFQRISRYPELVPVKTVNPLLPNWPESLEGFRKNYVLGAIKLFANYHLYKLSDERVHSVVEYAARARLPVLIPIQVEDRRQHHWLMPVPRVPIADICALAKRFPKARLFALNAYDELAECGSAPDNLYFDFSFVEFSDVLKGVSDTVSPRQLVFGSATPFLTTEAALEKLRLGTVDNKIRRQIVSNGNRLFGRLL